MNLAYELTLFFLLAVVAIATLVSTHKDRVLTSVVAFLAILFLAYQTSLPALAALAAQDEALSPQSKEFEEQLNVSPTGGQYVGIEYASKETNGEAPLNDEEIKDLIQSNVSQGVVVAVVNGSVRLSGRVRSKEAARHLLEQVKEIPGVHEITFDLGLEKRSI